MSNNSNVQQSMDHDIKSKEKDDLKEQGDEQSGKQQVQYQNIASLSDLQQNEAMMNAINLMVPQAQQKQPQSKGSQQQQLLEIVQKEPQQQEQQQQMEEALQKPQKKVQIKMMLRQQQQIEEKKQQEKRKRRAEQQQNEQQIIPEQKSQQVLQKQNHQQQYFHHQQGSPSRNQAFLEQSNPQLQLHSQSHLHSLPYPHPHLTTLCSSSIPPPIFQPLLKEQMDNANVADKNKTIGMIDENSDENNNSDQQKYVKGIKESMDREIEQFREMRKPHLSAQSYHSNPMDNQDDMLYIKINNSSTNRYYPPHSTHIYRPFSSYYLPSSRQPYHLHSKYAARLNHGNNNYYLADLYSRSPSPPPDHHKYDSDIADGYSSLLYQVSLSRPSATAPINVETSSAASNRQQSRPVAISQEQKEKQKNEWEIERQRENEQQKDRLAAHQNDHLYDHYNRSRTKPLDTRYFGRSPYHYPSLDHPFSPNRQNHISHPFPTYPNHPHIPATNLQIEKAGKVNIDENLNIDNIDDDNYYRYRYGNQQRSNPSRNSRGIDKARDSHNLKQLPQGLEKQYKVEHIEQNADHNNSNNNKDFNNNADHNDNYNLASFPSFNCYNHYDYDNKYPPKYLQKLHKQKICLQQEQNHSQQLLNHQNSRIRHQQQLQQQHQQHQHQHQHQYQHQHQHQHQNQQLLKQSYYQKNKELNIDNKKDDNSIRIPTATATAPTPNFFRINNSDIDKQISLLKKMLKTYQQRDPIFVKYIRFRLSKDIAQYKENQRYQNSLQRKQQHASHADDNSSNEKEFYKKLYLYQKYIEFENQKRAFIQKSFDYFCNTSQLSNSEIAMSGPAGAFPQKPFFDNFSPNKSQKQQQLLPQNPSMKFRFNNDGLIDPIDDDDDDLELSSFNTRNNNKTKKISKYGHENQNNINKKQFEGSFDSADLNNKKQKDNDHMNYWRAEGKLRERNKKKLRKDKKRSKFEGILQKQVYKDQPFDIIKSIHTSSRVDNNVSKISSQDQQNKSNNLIANLKIHSNENQQQKLFSFSKSEQEGDVKTKKHQKANIDSEAGSGIGTGIGIGTSSRIYKNTNKPFQQRGTKSSEQAFKNMFEPTASSANIGNTKTKRSGLSSEPQQSLENREQSFKDINHLSKELRYTQSHGKIRIGREYFQARIPLFIQNTQRNLYMICCRTLKNKGIEDSSTQ